MQSLIANPYQSDLSLKVSQQSINCRGRSTLLSRCKAHATFQIKYYKVEKTLAAPYLSECSTRYTMPDLVIEAGRAARDNILRIADTYLQILCCILFVFDT